MALERRPVALAKQVLLADLVRCIEVDEDEVGKPAFADIASLDDAEQVCGRVTGTVDEQLDADLAVGDEVEQAQHGVLHERQSGRRLEIRRRLLAGRMRRMVRRDDIDAAVIQCAVINACRSFGALDRRIALDLRAESLVLRLVEPQVMHADLGRNAFLGAVRLREQRHLDRRRQV